jgi:hypothetical protein
MNVVLVVTGSISCTLFWKIQEELEKENNVKVLFTKNAQMIANKELEYFFMEHDKAIYTHGNQPKYSKLSGRGYKYCNSINGKYHKYSCSFPVPSYFNNKELICDGGLEYEQYVYEETGKVEHIELCNWAEKVVIAPCTANTLTKIYQGITDSFVLSFLTAFLGTSKPCYIALAMNTHMYNNNAIQRVINELKQRCKFIIPTVKKLACGEVGIGALAYIGTIVNIVNEHKWNFPIKKQDLNGIAVCSGYQTLSDYIPTYKEPGSFGFKRKFEIHNGVDIYCKDGSDVFAVEDGVVVDIKPFTGKQNGTDWWNDTWAICVKGKSGVVCYGEMEEQFNFKIGDTIKTNDCIGKIKAVLPEHKIRKDIRHHNNAMLHIQLFKDYENDEQLADWYPNQERNKFLLDPTPYLQMID